MTAEARHGCKYRQFVAALMIVALSAGCTYYKPTLREQETYSRLTSEIPTLTCRGIKSEISITQRYIHNNYRNGHTGIVSVQVPYEEALLAAWENRCTAASRQKQERRQPREPEPRDEFQRIPEDPYTEGGIR